MFWNKKNGESALPDLPEIKSPFNQELPQTSKIDSAEENEDDESEDTETHILPSFPDSPIEKGFSQAAIKDAVSNESSEEHENIVGEEKKEENFKTIEMNDSSSQDQKTSTPSIVQSQPLSKQPFFQRVQETGSISALSETDKILPPSQYHPKTEKIQPQSLPYVRASEQKKEDIFVKIDRFHSAKKALEATKQQLDQIDQILKKIREVKLREEQELESWERELLTAKSRLKEVNENIFEKTE